MSLCLNWVLFCLFTCLAVFFFATNIRLEAPKKLSWYWNYANFFFLETDATVLFDYLIPQRDLIFGTWDRDPDNCARKRGGGWWYGIGKDWAVRSNLNGVFPRCGNETLADIHWGELVLTSAKGSAPTTEMKIRPLDFLRTFRKISNTTYLVNSDFRVFLSVQGLEVISNVKFTQ